MIIERKFAPYIVFSEEAVLVALNKMNASIIPFIFTVTEEGHLQGVLTAATCADG